MDLRRRLQGINTNLEDLQSGVDAGLREAAHVREAVGSIDRNKRKDGSPVGALIRHAKELESCVCDQRLALRELRKSLAGLRDDMIGSNCAVPPASATAADRRRR